MDLIHGYLTTTYALEDGDQVVGLRIGTESHQARAWMQSHGVHHMAFISAENPRSEVLAPQQNAERVRLMSARLQQLGLPSWPAEGIPDSPDWLPERGFFIDCGLAVVMRLAVEFEQNAVVMVEEGLPPALVICRRLV